MFKANIKAMQLELLDLSDKCKLAQEGGVNFSYVKQETMPSVFEYSSSKTTDSLKTYNIVDLVGELKEAIDFIHEKLLPSLDRQQQELLRHYRAKQAYDAIFKLGTDERTYHNLMEEMLTQRSKEHFFQEDVV